MRYFNDILNSGNLYDAREDSSSSTIVFCRCQGLGYVSFNLFVSVTFSLFLVLSSADRLLLLSVHRCYESTVSVFYLVIFRVIVLTRTNVHTYELYYTITDGWVQSSQKTATIYENCICYRSNGKTVCRARGTYFYFYRHESFFQEYIQDTQNRIKGFEKLSSFPLCSLHVFGIGPISFKPYVMYGLNNKMQFSTSRYTVFDRVFNINV